MTRSIPSIIVLTLMCFTIGYGLVQFPDAGILDAAQSSSSANPQTVTVMRQTADGSALQSGESATSSVLPETQTPSDELFSSSPAQNTTGSASDQTSASDANSNPAASEERAPAHNEGTNLGPVSRPNNVVKSDAAAAPYQATGLKGDTEQNVAVTAIKAPDNNNNFLQDNSLPIETDVSSLPVVGPLETDIPQVQVPSSSPEPEQPLESEPITEPEPITDPEPAFEMPPDDGQSAEDFWNEYLDNSSAKAPDPSEDADSMGTANQNAVETPTAPPTVSADPNAHEIPASVREKKPANKDALTAPAVNEPKKDTPSSNQPDNRTIPLETFPLDDEPAQPASFTTEVQQEPYDRFGFNIPASGQITVRRLPSAENSIDPIYNNAQLDRFAL